MKNLITLLIFILPINYLTAQDRVEISEFKIKKERAVRYKTDYKTHYKKVNIYFLNGKEFDGIIFENWENDSLKKEFEVKNGRRTGYVKSFYANGNIQIDSPKKSAMKEPGDYIIGYHENGEIWQAHTVLPNDNDAHKLTTKKWYNSNGQVVTILSFKDEARQGIMYFYDEQTGDLRSQVSYKNGVRHGLEYSYPLYGESKIINWKNGENLEKEFSR
jgi:antitoxin component YwqK of YwqJK toxin-antitoxin module